MRAKVLAITLIILVTLVLSATAGSAQGPEPAAPEEAQAPLGSAFTYQGQLIVEGQPANGSYDLEFYLFNAGSGGTQIGAPVAVNNLEVQNGLFTVQLDFGAAPFKGQARWLEIRVREGGSNAGFTTLTPRQQLTPTPYALWSREADRLDGLDATAFASASHQHDASEITSGTLGNARFSAYSDLGAEGRLDNNAGGDLLTRAQGDGRYWKLTGNAGTTVADFLGTTDNTGLTLKVNGTTALRLLPAPGTPNLVGGYEGNLATTGVLGAAIAGGGAAAAPNRVTDNYGTVSGGTNNLAGSDDNATNNASYATAGGGFLNQASADYATVGGGAGNQASGGFATVGGGFTNRASAPHSTVGGGFENRAGTYATVPGGVLNSALGTFSFAAGRRAKASHQGAFVWADSQDADMTSGANNQFVVRAEAGLFLTGNSTLPTDNGFINTSTGAYLSNGGDWTNASDAALKENFAPVNGRQILAHLASLPIATWNYTREEPAVRHIGPTAQDFATAFGVGADNRHISTVDANGVAFAAIQGLHQLVEEKDAEIAALERENQTQQVQIEVLEARLVALERAESGTSLFTVRSPRLWAPLLAGLGLAVLWRQRRGRGQP